MSALKGLQKGLLKGSRRQTIHENKTQTLAGKG